MATDKLINQTQGDDIIDALSDIADNVGNITYGPQTSSDKVVSMLGYAEAAEAASINPGDTLNQAIGKLEKKADDNATEIENKIDKLTNATAGDIATVTSSGEIADSEVAIETTLSDSSDAKVPTSKAVGTYVADKGYAVGVTSSTANNLVAFNDANGKALKDSGIAVDKSSTGLTDSDTAVPTSKTVKTYVDSTATGISRYLGTITAASGLSTSAKKGDFYVVKTAWTGVHAGDEIIAEKDNPAQTIDGTNWSLLHNEADTDTKYTFATGTTNGTFKVTPSDTGTAQSVPIKGLGNAAYKGVADTVSTSTDLVTSAAVNTKLASYVPNSDFVVAEQNILYNLNTGVKNIINIYGTPTASQRGITYTNMGDGSYKVNGTVTTTPSYVDLMYDIPLSMLHLKVGDRIVLTSNSTKVYTMCTARFSDSTTGTNESGNIDSPFTFTIPDNTVALIIRLAVYSVGTNVSNEIVYPMICTLDAWNQSHDYQSPALPNCDLTRLASEDRASLAEVVDSGAKNIAVPSVFGNVTGLTITQSNGHYVVSGTTTASFTHYIYDPSSAYVCTETMVALGAKVATGMAPMVQYVDPENIRRYVTITTGSYITIPAGSSIEKIYFQKQGTSSLTVNVDYYMMICTKAAFGVSSKFVPYRPNWDLVYAAITRSNNLSLKKMVSFSTSAANTYEIITNSKITVPANKMIRISATGMWRNSYCTGIKIQIGNDLRDNRTLAINETTTAYNGLPVTATYYNDNTSDIDLYVAARTDNTTASMLVIIYDIV